MCYQVSRGNHGRSLHDGAGYRKARQIGRPFSAPSAFQACKAGLTKPGAKPQDLRPPRWSRPVRPVSETCKMPSQRRDKGPETGPSGLSRNRPFSPNNANAAAKFHDQARVLPLRLSYAGTAPLRFRPVGPVSPGWGGAPGPAARPTETRPTDWAPAFQSDSRPKWKIVHRDGN